ncbi:MAG TPA: NAD-dependent epimerase/dehydratase family protein [bacterium]|nr:NAD-dependent epimerase/dehydratase family protein [bacterium]
MPAFELPFRKALVTGAAGFIGSNLADRLLAEGVQVVGYDNFSTGSEDFLRPALAQPGFKLVRGDLLDPEALLAAAQGCEFVFHLAANADVRFGLQHPRKDLEQNTLATFNVLEAARQAGMLGIAFSSTGSVYGEPNVFPTPEDAPFPTQTSLYGASKLAGEGMIQAYATGFGLRAFIFRFVSILGERYTHGHVFDFTKRLREDPSRLEILGDGQQKKSYLYVQDCVDGIFTALSRAQGPLNIFNLGCDEACRVDDSIGWICGRLGVDPRRVYSGGQRGWIGDSPFIFLDTTRIRALGWTPRLDIRQGVVKTVEYLQANPQLFGRR